MWTQRENITVSKGLLFWIGVWNVKLKEASCMLFSTDLVLYLEALCSTFLQADPRYQGKTPLQLKFLQWQQHHYVT